MEVEVEENDVSIITAADPRDAFLLMLLERIGSLETRLHELEKGQQSLDDRQNTLQKCIITDPVIDENATVIGIQHTMFSFIIKAIPGVQVTEDQLRQDAVAILEIVVPLLGSSILSATAVIIESRLEMVINLRKRVWRQEWIRLLSKTHLPRNVEVIDEMVARYSIYMSPGKRGLCYNVFDMLGQKKEQPTWEEWADSFFIISQNVVI